MGVRFRLRDRCPLCEGDNHRLLCELAYCEAPLKTFIDEFYQGRVPGLADASYRVVACEACDFIYQDQVLDDTGMQALYEEWVDHAHSLRKKQQAKAARYRQYAGQVQTLMRCFAGPPDDVRVLDYGMGWGYWSRMAQAHGLCVEGHELSTRRVTHARGMGLEVIDALPPPGPHYDFIYANQIFEHLPDPLQTLRDLGACLAPRGVIYLRVPDGRGVASWIEQRGWAPGLDAIHPLEHINCFTRKTLIALGRSAGLKQFDAPLRLHWGSLWGGIRREISDRYLTTHVYFSA